MSNFEKQIKQQGETFSIEPREQVWHRVEAELNKKKDRRIAGWWWMAPIALLMGGGIFYYGVTYKENKQQPIVSNSRPSTNTATTPARETQNTKKENQEHPAIKNVITTKTATKNAIRTKKNNGSHSNDNALLKQSSVAQTNKNNNALTPATSNAKAITPSPAASIVALADVKIKEPGASEPAIQPGIVLGAAVGKEVLLQSNNNISSSTYHNDVTTSNNNLLPEKNSSAAVNSMDSASEAMNFAITKQPKEKTKWRLLVSGGVNNNTENDVPLLAFLEDQNKAFAANPQNNTGSGVNQSTGLSVQSNKTGVSFGVGLQRLQWLGKRWQWQAGIGAQYHQIQQTTGIRKDSIISQSASNNFSYSADYFYGGGSSVSNTGHNYRVFLSTDFAFALLKHKPSLMLTAGLYTGFNVCNNYLVPDYYNSLYIKSEDLYEKWFAGINLGLEYNFKNRMSLGILGKYDLTKSFTTLGGDKQYWQSFLLNIGIPISKK